MRSLPLVLILAIALAAPTAAAARDVTVGDDYFVRPGDIPTIKVKKGTTVTWEWTGRREHNVVAQRGPTSFQSALKKSGNFSRKLRRVGTYKIVCSIHSPDMAMTLKVRRRG
ncbi:MAG TPA: plastocyanin/azurin family copper-binding protein [Solirubrobacteraceae bacterium]|nr:plastocyanin/azurin family copper-binding protein [Solirubrobacteraceae bacterium]